VTADRRAVSGNDTMPRTLIVAGLLAAAFASGFAVAQSTATTGRAPQFENPEVKVWKSVVLPHDPLPPHRHEHPRVIIALTGGTMELVEQGGRRETHLWETGHAYWLPANPPGTLHQDVNVGDKPIEVMVVELETAG
jgi:quercetin dioxygenase-like cupin family protein